MNKDELRDQINELIKGEIQENINEYVDSQEETKKAGLGFVNDNELKVSVSEREINKIIKQYKKIKKSERSNLSHIKKLG